MPNVTLLHGDSLAILGDPAGVRSPDGSLILGGVRKAHAVVTDPPYGFDFAGSKDWDSFTDDRTHTSAADDAAQFSKFTRDWSYRLRTEYLWPGAHLLAFSADRTIDLVGRGLREAGFDIVRLMFWMYASGQVKNPNDLRPGCEPIFVCRVPSDQNLTKIFKEKGIGQMHAQVWKAEDGRHPTNMLVSEEAVAIDPDLTRLVNEGKSSFFVPKVSPKDRDSYCGDLPLQEKDSKISHISMADNSDGRSTSHFADGTRKPVLAQNFHPTVKPIELMRRIIRLVSKPGHLIVDPFLGSGSTGVAAVLEGRAFLGIEREPDYFKVCSTRIANALRSVGDDAQADRLLSAVQDTSAA